MLNTTIAGIMGLGATEMILILGVVLLIFGGRKIPELMRGLGKGVREFKDASGNNATPAPITPEEKTTTTTLNP